MGNSESRVHQIRDRYDAGSTLGSSSNRSTPTTVKKKNKFLSLRSLPTISRSISPCKHHDKVDNIPVILKDPAPESPNLDPFERHNSPCSRSHSSTTLERQNQEQAQANLLQLPFSTDNHDSYEQRSYKSSQRSTKSDFSDSTHRTCPSVTISDHTLSATFYRSSPEPERSFYRQRKPSMDISNNKRLSQITQHSTFSKTMGSSDKSTDENDDEDQALNRPGFHFAEDMWNLRGQGQFSELIRDKHRRTHFFLKRVWKADILAPLDNPSLMIHWASSPGSWCLEMALSYPNTTIVGIDQIEQSNITFASVSNLFLHQCPIYGPDGGMALFENDSADLIVLRDDFIYLVPKHQWGTLLAQFYRVLKPGGHLELYGQDYTLNATDPDGKILDQWTHRLADRSGASFDFYNVLDTFCDQLGFGERDFRQVDLPIGDWPESQPMKEIGYLAKIIIYKRFKLLKHWILALEPAVTEENYSTTLRNAMEACERDKQHFISYYFGVQKPPVN